MFVPEQRLQGKAETTPTVGITTGWRGSCPGGGGSPADQRSCSTAVPTAASCFASAKGLPGLETALLTTREVSDGKIPAGCSVAANAGNNSASVVFNSNTGSTGCCGLDASSTVLGTTSALGGMIAVELLVSGEMSTVNMTLTGPADVWFGVGFDALVMLDSP